ncbi:MAG: dNTP triphosphohydrolase [Planctomycetaceae bacterium]|nr:dNTP triphosphohydrolase [Planctomycetaceae bacterium]
MNDVTATNEWSMTIAERERLLLAPYAMHSVDSAGRVYPEPVHPYRGPFQRDRDRVVHSAAYRRLSGKTQVFTGEMGDYHRTRLTHTIEVASLARTLARALRLNEDLVEALAMMHDLGHPPFGHSGEDVLDECMPSCGGFSHNGHTLRLVEVLEQRYPEFAGLNLSREMLDGQGYRVRKQSNDQRPLLEVQVVDAADSIAYDSHDADDALELKLLTLGDLAEIPLWREAAARVRGLYQALSERELKQAIVHELLVQQVNDILKHTWQRLAELRPDSVVAVRAAAWLVAPGAELAEQKVELERFLYQRVYRHPKVLRVRARAQEQLRIMFQGYVQDPDMLPAGFRSRLAIDGVERTVGDYLAGMTDRYARRQFADHFERV